MASDIPDASAGYGEWAEPDDDGVSIGKLDTSFTDFMFGDPFDTNAKTGTPPLVGPSGAVGTARLGAKGTRFVQAAGIGSSATVQQSAINQSQDVGETVTFVSRETMETGRETAENVGETVEETVKEKVDVDTESIEDALSKAFLGGGALVAGVATLAVIYIVGQLFNVNLG